MNHEKRPTFLPRCPQCGCAVEYSHRHHSYLFPTCNRWLEPTCADSECEFCAGRPIRPFAVIVERHEAAG
jgi:hypothetical protein